MNKIQHKYQEEILVPLGAVEGNIEFLLEKKGEFEMSDGVKVSGVLLGTLHAISPEFSHRVRSLYGVEALMFLETWYDRLGWRFCSNEMLNIKLIRKDD